MQASALDLANQLNESAASLPHVQLVVCPSFVHLAPVKTILNAAIHLGAQNCHEAEKGAFTGEISAPMLKDLGCQYVVVGHSERRHGLGETNECVAKKAKISNQFGLIPIICVGELLADREANRAEQVVSQQLRVLPQDLQSFIVAYEPVWAIGTGKVATPDAVANMHRFIFEVLSEHFGQSVAKKTAILYGGSVKAENAATLMHLPHVSGALVGGASLDAKEFVSIGQAMA